MIRMGLRASNLSKRTNFDAGDNAQKPLMPLWIIHVVLVSRFTHQSDRYINLRLGILNRNHSN